MEIGKNTQLQIQEPPGNSYSTSNKKKVFIDAIQEEDESLKSVKEIERETEEQRLTRRTTLHFKYSSEHKKSEMVPDSIDIRRLDMNMYLKQPLEIDKTMLQLYHSDRGILIEIVRKGSFRLVNYTQVFIQKAEILLTIMIDLFVEFQKKVDKLQQSFENLEDCMLPWIDIIKNIPIDISIFEQLEPEKEENEAENLSPDSKYEDLVRHRENSRIRGYSRNLTNLSLNTIGLNTFANQEPSQEDSPLMNPRKSIENECQSGSLNLKPTLDYSSQFLLSTGSQDDPYLTLSRHKSACAQYQPSDSIILEDPNEERKSSDLGLSQASQGNLDSLEPINDQPYAQHRDTEGSQFLIKDRSGTGSSNLSKISQTSNKQAHEEKIKTDYNTITLKKEYCTKKDLFNLHNQILVRNKKILKTLKSKNKNLHKSINNIVVEGGFQDNLNQIRKLLAEYSKVFSLICRNIKDGEDLFSNLNPRRSIFVLESDICRQMKLFRQSLDEKLLEKFQMHSQTIQSIIHPHHEFVRSKMEEINHYGQNMYQDNWTASPYTKGWFRESLEPINYFKIISPGYRRYMKKKLGLSRNSDVNNEDLVDFFKYFQMNYLVESSFCAGWISGKYTAQSGQVTKCILALDVKF